MKLTMTQRDHVHKEGGDDCLRQITGHARHTKKGGNVNKKEKIQERKKNLQSTTIKRTLRQETL